MPDLQPVFDELVRRLSVHEDVFHVTTNITDANAAGGRREDAPDPGTYLLLGAPSAKYPAGESFAGVRVGKRYVSVHLMCVYRDPALTEGISPDLARRRQGKSCFTFTRVDDAVLDELFVLVDAARAWFLDQGLAPAPHPGR